MVPREGESHREDYCDPKRDQECGRCRRQYQQRQGDEERNQDIRQICPAHDGRLLDEFPEHEDECRKHTHHAQELQAVTNGPRVDQLAGFLLLTCRHDQDCSREDDSQRDFSVFHAALLSSMTALPAHALHSLKYSQDMHAMPGDGT